MTAEVAPKVILASTGGDIGIISSIMLLLVVARVLGELMNQMRQSPIVGEILAGVILGPAVLGLVSRSGQLEGIAELGVFFILLAAGMEMNFRQVMRAFLGPAAILGAISFAIPLSAGAVLGLVFGFTAIESVVLGLVVAITALPVIIRILANFGLLDSRVSEFAIATAIFNDMAALFFLGVILELGKLGKLGKGVSFEGLVGLFSQTGGQLLILLGIIFLVYLFLFLAGEKAGYIKLFLEKTMARFGSEVLFGVCILFVLFFGAISELFSSHFIIGVFFGGLLIDKDVMGPELFGKLEDTLSSINSGLLAPIFFAFIGLAFSWEPLLSPYTAIFAVAVIFVSVASKVLAARLGGRLAKMSPTEAVGVGIVLNSRGTMDLVVAQIALSLALISSKLFSTMVLLAIISTVITPILFKRMVLGKLKSGGDDSSTAMKVPATLMGSASSSTEATSDEHAPDTESDSGSDDEPKEPPSGA